MMTTSYVDANYLSNEPHEILEEIFEDDDEDLNSWMSIIDKDIIELELELALQCIQKAGKISDFREFCLKFTDLNLLELIELFASQYPKMH